MLCIVEVLLGRCRASSKALTASMKLSGFAWTLFYKRRAHECKASVQCDLSCPCPPERLGRRSIKKVVNHQRHAPNSDHQARVLLGISPVLLWNTRIMSARGYDAIYVSDRRCFDDGDSQESRATSTEDGGEPLRSSSNPPSY